MHLAHWAQVALEGLAIGVYAVLALVLGAALILYIIVGGNKR